MIYFVIGLAGVLGALSRYYLGLFVHTWWIMTFPLGTFIINMSGCLVLGWFHTWVAKFKAFPSWLRLGIGTGFVGSFTTFSTFSTETVELLQKGLWGMSLLYILSSLWGGLLMAWLGYRLANRHAIPRGGKTT